MIDIYALSGYGGTRSYRCLGNYQLAPVAPSEVARHALVRVNCG